MTVTRRGAQSQGEEAQPHTPQTQDDAAIDVDMEGPQDPPAPDTLQPFEVGSRATPPQLLAGDPDTTRLSSGAPLTGHEQAALSATCCS